MMREILALFGYVPTSRVDALERDAEWYRSKLSFANAAVAHYKGRASYLETQLAAARLVIADLQAPTAKNDPVARPDVEAVK